MNKFYFILPVLLLIGFGLYYTQIAQPEMQAAIVREQQHQAEIQKADEIRQAAIQQKSQEDARRVQAERDAKQRAAQEKARLEKEAQDRAIREETAKFEDEAARLTKQIATSSGRSPPCATGASRRTANPSNWPSRSSWRRSIAGRPRWISSACTRWSHRRSPRVR